jgi:hypothetical protein
VSEGVRKEHTRAVASVSSAVKVHEEEPCFATTALTVLFLEVFFAITKVSVYSGEKSE